MKRPPGHLPFEPDTSVDQIMRRWPETIGVAIRRGLLCVGCPIGTFHTLGEACAVHGLDEQGVTEDILAAIEQANP